MASVVTVKAHPFPAVLARRPPPYCKPAVSHTFFLWSEPGRLSGITAGSGSVPSPGAEGPGSGRWEKERAVRGGPVTESSSDAARGHRSQRSPCPSHPATGPRARAASGKASAENRQRVAPAQRDGAEYGGTECSLNPRKSGWCLNESRNHRESSGGLWSFTVVATVQGASRSDPEALLEKGR